MARKHPTGLGPGDVLLEAEVNKNKQSEFSKRYLAATGDFVCTGDPPEYQDQPNKWGQELRIYFCADAATIANLKARKLNVTPTGGYRGQFDWRINDNEFWWQLVEKYEYRLGVN